MNAPLNLLVIEDSPADFLLLQRHLRKEKLEATCACVASLPELEEALAGSPWDAILADYNLPGMRFESTLELIQRRRPDLPVLILSGTVGEERAVELLKLGVADFILKDNLPRLVPTLRHCLREANEQRIRQAAEAELRKSRLFKQAILDSMSAHLAVVDRNGVIVAVNQPWQSFALENSAEPGQPARRTNIGVNYLEVCREASGEWSEGAMVVHDGISAVLEGRQSHFIHEYPCHSPREQRWFSMSATLLDSSDGGAVIAHSTITARKQVEMTLERERGFLKTLVQTIPDLIWLKDPEGVFLACNPRFEQLLGAREADIVGKTDYDFMDRKVADAFREKDRAAIAADQPCINEEEVPFADGHWEWVETIKTPMRDGEGRLIGVLGIARDISAARRNEAALRESEAQLRKLAQAVEQSPESIIITDLNARIEYANEAFLSATGYSRAEVLGQNWRILQSNRTLPETYESLWTALSQGQSWHGELCSRRKDGGDYIEFAHIAPIRQPDGRITHYLALKEDITEKKRIGAELDRYRHHLEELVAERTVQLAEARERAEAANRAKSAFLANMSHEIRTPLNAIIGFAHLLQRGVPMPRQVERLGQIGEAARHLLGILNNILDLSKIEAGKVALEHTDFHLATILDYVRSLIAGPAKAKGIALEVSSNAVFPWLRGDPTRLSQALLNYASNAVKFTERGVITLGVHLLEEQGDQLLVRFEVRDSGIGLTPEQKDRIFEAFEQAEVSTTRQYGGTGLGLAITQRLVSLMDGEVGVDTQPGVGSTFWFTARLERGQGAFPAVSTVSVTDAEYELPRHHAGARLLLVEDNAINRDVALELLHAVNLTVDTAANGQEAVARVRTTAYDLILMDMQMPIMDGLEATRIIRTLPGRDHTPILAMTASAFIGDQRQCLASGMNDHISKPVDPAALYARLLHWLPTSGAAPLQSPPPSTIATPAAENDLDEQRFSAIPGLDLAQGLAIASGKRSFYRRLLALFIDRHGEDVERLREALHANDRVESQYLAHTLKGATASLGAMRIPKRADALYAAIRSGAGREEIEHCFQVLAAELTSLLTGIRAALADDAPAVEPAAADLTRLDAVLADLDPLLEMGDMASTELARTEESLLCAGLGPTGDILLRQIAGFDYEAALITLRAYRESRASHA